MTTWTFKLRGSLGPNGCMPRIDARRLQLDTLRSLSPAEIERLEMATPFGSVALGELCHVDVTQTSESRGVDRIKIEGDACQWDFVGAEHRDGEFIVEGNVGDWCGWSMRGGQLEVRGSTANGLAAAMRDGTIRVAGSAGDSVAGPLGSSHTGMRGGVVHVAGDVGHYAGARMRRGVVIVEGNAGSFAASQMIAGTLCVAGTLGPHAAYGIRRGTFVTRSVRPFCDQRYSRPNRLSSSFGTLFDKFLRQSLEPESPLSQLLDRMRASGIVTRRGDRAVGGQAELMAPVEKD